MLTHKLKVIPAVYNALQRGKNYIEIVDDNRLYNKGDVLKIREYIPLFGMYTYRSKKVTILSVTRVHRAEMEKPSIRFYVNY